MVEAGYKSCYPVQPQVPEHVFLPLKMGPLRCVFIINTYFIKVENLIQCIAFFNYFQ